jgi:hypothetical protein
MNASLTPELEKFIGREVESGSASAFGTRPVGSFVPDLTLLASQFDVILGGARRSGRGSARWCTGGAHLLPSLSFDGASLASPSLRLRPPPPRTGQAGLPHPARREGVIHRGYGSVQLVRAFALAYSRW